MARQGGGSRISTDLGQIFQASQQAGQQGQRTSLYRTGYGGWCLVGAQPGAALPAAQGVVWLRGGEKAKRSVNLQLARHPSNPGCCRPHRQ
jgi:hypothetical protein